MSQHLTLPDRLFVLLAKQYTHGLLELLVILL